MVCSYRICAENRANIVNVLGAQKILNHLIKMVLLITHSIYFGSEIRKLFLNYLHFWKSEYGAVPLYSTSHYNPDLDIAQ